MAGEHLRESKNAKLSNVVGRRRERYPHYMRRALALGVLFHSAVALLTRSRARTIRSLTPGMETPIKSTPTAKRKRGSKQPAPHAPTKRGARQPAHTPIRSPHFGDISPPPKAEAAPSPAKGNLPPLLSTTTPPHTLFLGTQPSDNSLRSGRYFATNANAFWHIAGDALGFRRGWHLDGRSEAVDFIRPHLTRGDEVGYDEAVARLTAAGYAVWDAVAASKRRGSLDSAIRDADFADVRSLCDAHPSIRRICFTTGTGSAARFARGNAAWLAGAPFWRSDDDLTSSVKALSRLPTADVGGLQLVVLESVSPASNPRPTWTAAAQAKKGHADAWAARPAALYPYKRRSWFERAFADEAIVKATPPFGSRPADYRGADGE